MSQATHATRRSIGIKPQLIHALGREFRRYRWVLGCSFAYLPMVMLGLWWLPVSGPDADTITRMLLISLTGLVANLTLVTAAAMALGKLGWLGRRPRALWADINAADASARVLILVLVWPAFVVFFVQWKSVFSVSVPWHLDGLFVAWDLWLHGGVLPSRFLAQWLIQPGILFAGGVLYDIIWPFVICVGLPAYAMAFGADRQRGARYMLATVLCWILLGSIMAPLTYSVGPAFAQLVTGLPLYPDLYAAVQAAGAQAAAPALIPMSLARVHEGFVHAAPGTMPGILAMSAMPSLHLAIAMLTVCYAWAYGWRWRIPALVCLVGLAFVAVASGWHYAVDVYVAVAGAMAIWWGCGRRWFQFAE